MNFTMDEINRYNERIREFRQKIENTDDFAQKQIYQFQIELLEIRIKISKLKSQRK